MFGLPMHPLLIHLPLVLAMLLPILAAWVFWKIRQPTGERRRIWTLWVGAQMVLAVSTFLASQAGEKDAEQVEKQVPEAALESHEEQGERFVFVTAGTAALSLAGYIPGPIGQSAQVLALIGSLGQLGLVLPLGHSGAVLVYQHGANAAFAQNAGQAAPESAKSQEKGDDD
jgi:uncharacterized membrane protein